LIRFVNVSIASVDPFDTHAQCLARICRGICAGAPTIGQDDDALLLSR
jgi:hypothetical protein